MITITMSKRIKSLTCVLVRYLVRGRERLPDREQEEMEEASEQGKECPWKAHHMQVGRLHV